MLGRLTVNLKVGGSNHGPAEPGAIEESGQLSAAPRYKNHEVCHIKRKNKGAASIS